jgi:hypothetical protein
MTTMMLMMALGMIMLAPSEARGTSSVAGPHVLGAPLLPVARSRRASREEPRIRILADEPAERFRTAIVDRPERGTGRA